MTVDRIDQLLLMSRVCEAVDDYLQEITLSEPEFEAAEKLFDNQFAGTVEQIIHETLFRNSAEYRALCGQTV